MSPLSRQPLYAKIAIARKQLPDMDEETYRALLGNTFRGKTSSTKLSYAELNRLVDMLADMGAVFTAKGASCAQREPSDAKRSHGNTRVTPKARPDWIEVHDGDEHGPQKRAILAIWKKLGYSMSSLETRVRREFLVESFAWLHDPDQIKRLLTDLQARERAFDRKAASNG
jgi:phage gp16-like protein